MDLRLDQVSKRYGVRLPWVVRDVSLDIAAGGLVRFEGRNGCGKSTLLRVIAGASLPSSGSVTGRPVAGYVPERFPPALPFPARDYLAHLGRVRGLAGADLDARIQSCLERLGGTDIADIPLRNMSKGMCQKVAVAQALLPGAGLLVLDEAWTGLDAEAKAALDETVAERLTDGGSVVFVDHDARRLDHLQAERWRIENGRATRVEGDGRGEPGKADEAGGEPVVVEVTGSLDVELVRLMPGVLSAARVGDRVVIRAEPGASDAVLRGLLDGGDPIHVVRVHAEGQR